MIDGRREQTRRTAADSRKRTTAWRIPRAARHGATATALAVLCASAWAQDYVKTNATGLLETRPANAASLGLRNVGSYIGAAYALPFEFPYYGRAVTSVFLTPSGFILPNGTAGFLNQTLNGNAPGMDATSHAFPYTTPTSLTNGNADGIIAPFWGPINVYDGVASQGDTYYWTSGTAPTRHFVVSWENVYIASSSSPRITFQVQLYEGTGRIVFAYSTTGLYTSQYYVCGIDSFGDGRYTCPLSNTNQNAGYPGGDFVFDPRTVTYTGTALYDKFVSDAGGIGNSVLANQPLSGQRLELRLAGGVLSNSTTTADDGTFTIQGVGVSASSSGTLTVMTDCAACGVRNLAGSAAEWTFDSNVNFAGGSAVGTFSLGTSGDSAGALRSPFNVALACKKAYDWASARTAATIPRLDVVFDPTAAFVTDYQPAGINAAVLRIGVALGGNPDAWDDAVITRTYARHVLASIATLPTTTADHRFDAVTDTQNAFAEAFGYYLWAAVSGASTAVDGKSATSATVYDLEHPTITVAKGPDVAGCVASMLYDLLDPANETIDTVDGTSAPDRVFHLVDAFTVAPTASTFQQAWIDAGYDAAGITRIYVGDGLLPDDASEPNDSAAEAAALGSIGVLRRNLVLNRFNEDWFSVTLPAAATSLVADATYDRVSLNTVIVFEIRDASGQPLATGAPLGASGPIHAATAGVPAGTYKIGVRHVSGVAIPAYSVQSYQPLGMAAAPLVDWTVGRAYDVSLGVVGGITPFAATTSSSAMPPGLGLDSARLRAGGTPTARGTYQVTVQVADGGAPANVVQCTQAVTIHDVFKIPVAPFVGFPAGKSVDATLPTHEGTRPFALSMSSGALTTGLAFDPNSFHVVGTATAGPSSAFALDGVDVAGSADHVDLRAVVAVELSGKKVPASLVAGTDACGWWFDAVEGSTVSFSVATAKGQPKRALTGALLAPDRSLVASGMFKTKSGSLAASKIVCPQSGRYYFVASSADAGAATQLLGTLGVALPKSGKGADKSFAPKDTTTFTFGALPGAMATVKFAGDKKQGLVAKVVSVLDPTGAPIVFVGGLKTSALGGTLTLPLTIGGTWTVVLGATSQSGTPGTLTYSYAVKQAKGAVYSAD